VVPLAHNARAAIRQKMAFSSAGPSVWNSLLLIGNQLIINLQYLKIN